jgi:type IV pilus assembly protein PilQ
MSMLARMNNNWKLGIALLCVLLTGTAPAQSQRSLTGMDVLSLDGNRVQLTLKLSDPAPEPVVFTIDKPARISMDLPDTRVALAERFRKINIGTARSVASAEAKGRTRVVVELSELTPYTVRTEGNNVVLTIEGAGVAAGASASIGGGRPTTSAISSIDFRRGEKGEGRVVVHLTDPRASVDVRDEGGRIVASFKNTAVPDALVKRLDALDFATPVKYIDTRRDGINAEISVTPIAGSDFEQVAYQAGDLFTIELQPLSQDKLEEKKKLQPQWTGERISLSFQAVDIRALLQIIADVAGTNMVVSDTVNGQIAMRLQNVPWDQALDIIMRTKGLGMRQQGNVMIVAPLAELAERERLDFEQEKSKKELAPLRSEIIQVNYAKATDIGALLKSETNSILTTRGRVSVDERTNTLLVLETRETIAEIRALVARLDIPVRQVLIESRIVIASDDFARDLGVRFGVNSVGTVGNTTVGQAGSNTGSRLNAGIREVGSTGNIPSLTDSYLVNLPIGGGGALAWSILGKNFLVDLELSALQTEGRGEVLSSPRIVTANGKEASITQGTQIPYVQSTASGATSAVFKDAVLGLSVTPQITPDSRVVMDLKIQKDTPGQVVQTTLGPASGIDIRHVNTRVMVKSGETVVLGGIFEQTTDNTVSKVPVFGDVPIMGNLFKTTHKSLIKNELLVFVTPKVLQEGLRVD